MMKVYVVEYNHPLLEATVWVEVFEAKEDADVFVANADKGLQWDVVETQLC